MRKLNTEMLKKEFHKDEKLCMIENEKGRGKTMFGKKEFK